MAEYYSSIHKAESGEEESLKQLVGFMLGGELFGVDILMVQEIIRSTTITRVPNAPDFVEGVINLRGNILPVIDLRKRLNMEAKEKTGTEGNRTWILILTVDNRVTGFIVDLVTEVLKIDEHDIEPPPDIIVSGLESQYIVGVCNTDDRLMILLNFNRILLLEEIRKLKSMDMPTLERGR
jgi:purine-binding chemotaxis protein CheW